MTDQLTLPLADDDSIQVGTARVVLLGRQWKGAEIAQVVEAGEPGTDFCGTTSWGVGTLILAPPA